MQNAMYVHLVIRISFGHLKSFLSFDSLA